jgi:hypothetical protein
MESHEVSFSLFASHFFWPIQSRSGQSQLHSHISQRSRCRKRHIHHSHRCHVACGFRTSSIDWTGRVESMPLIGQVLLIEVPIILDAEMRET